jgi:hypothetical protein
MSADNPEKPEPTPRPLVLPPRPIEPDPQECCRRGCEPCIFDYYHNALERWEEKVAQLTAATLVTFDD